TSGQQADAQKNQVERNAKTSDLIPWSIQEIRRIAQRLARKRIQPADVIAWSLWRRAHQAAWRTSTFTARQLSFGKGIRRFDRPSREPTACLPVARAARPGTRRSPPEFARRHV